MKTVISMICAIFISAQSYAEVLTSDEVSRLKQLLEYVEFKNDATVGYKNTIVIKSANLNIVNGTNGQDTTNGYGNVIIGYGRTQGTYGKVMEEATGSHNLILGDGHRARGRHSIIAGHYNTCEGRSSLISGMSNSDNVESLAGTVSGERNIIYGRSSAITGGFLNRAYSYSVVAGGMNNVATNCSSIMGGRDNFTNGNLSVTIGGANNVASNDLSLNIGGSSNRTDGALSLNIGGYYNYIAGINSIILGGSNNFLNTNESFIANSGFTSILFNNRYSIYSGNEQEEERLEYNDDFLYRKLEN